MYDLIALQSEIPVKCNLHYHLRIMDNRISEENEKKAASCTLYFTHTVVCLPIVMTKISLPSANL